MLLAFNTTILNYSLLVGVAITFIGAAEALPLGGKCG